MSSNSSSDTFNEEKGQHVPVMWLLGVLASFVGTGAIFWMTSMNSHLDAHAAQLSETKSRLASIEAVLPRILTQLDRIESEVRKNGSH